jgi:Effector Associated Constant Component 1
MARPGAFFTGRQSLQGSDRSAFGWQMLLGEGSVLIQVGVVEGDAAAIGSFFRWLTRDREMRRHAEVSLADAGSAGEMGALDLINVVLTQSVGLLSLAVAYAGWRDSRVKAPQITVTVGGTTIVLADESAASMQRKLQALLDDPGPGGDAVGIDHATGERFRTARMEPS